MCRHLAYLGTAPRSLAELLLEPEHGLLVQSYAPRRQRHGTINADGWGVGFFATARAVPARWRSNRPLWGDASFASLAPVISSTCVLAAVRSASAGMPLDETAVAPFQSGSWLLSHNGDRRPGDARTPSGSGVCVRLGAAGRAPLRASVQSASASSSPTSGSAIRARG